MLTKDQCPAKCRRYLDATEAAFAGQGCVHPMVFIHDMEMAMPMDGVPKDTLVEARGVAKAIAMILRRCCKENQARLER